MGILYKQTAEYIEDYIRSLPPGTDRLPAEREFCNMLNISRQTLRHALDLCENKGLIEKRRGSGIYLSASYKRTVNRIALLVPYSDDYIYPGVIRLLENRLRELMYSLETYDTHDSMEETGSLLNMLYRRGISCIIISTVRNALPAAYSPILKKLSDSGTKIIFWENPNNNLSDYSYIKSDSYFAGFSIGEDIAGIGISNICAILMHDSLTSYDKYLGLIDAFSENGMTGYEDNIHRISYSSYLDMEHNGNTVWLNNLMDSLKSVPSVFICDNDVIAYWLLKVLNSKNIPAEDIRLYSFDNSYLCKILNHEIISYGTDIDVLIDALVALSTDRAKKEKEVVTLPSIEHRY